eukprot:m.37754 g.37754  ORF g.37754 m.37754 type:complete len:454 (+) comp12544_c0_seq1:59-1420(+)
MASPPGADSRLKELLGQLPEPVRWLIGQQLDSLAQLKTAITPLQTKQASTSAPANTLQSRVKEVVPSPRARSYTLRPVYKCQHPNCTRQYRTSNGWASHQRKVHSLSVSASDAPESADTDLRTLVRPRGLWQDYELDSTALATTPSTPPLPLTAVVNKSPRAGPSLQHIGNQQPMLDILTIVSCQHCHKQFSIKSLESHYSRCRTASRRRSKRSQPTAAATTASLASQPLLNAHCTLPDALVQQPLAIWTHMPRSPTASRIPSSLDLAAPVSSSSDEDATDSGEDAASIDSGVGLEPAPKRSKASVPRQTRRARPAAPRSKAAVTATTTVATPSPPLLAQAPQTSTQRVARGHVAIYRSPNGVQAHLVPNPSGYAVKRTFAATPYGAARVSSGLPYGYNASVARSYGTAYAQAKMSYTYSRPVASASSHESPPPLLHYQHLGFHLNMTYNVRL